MLGTVALAGLLNRHHRLEPLANEVVGVEFLIRCERWFRHAWKKNARGKYKTRADKVFCCHAHAAKYSYRKRAGWFGYV